MSTWLIFPFHKWSRCTIRGGLFLLLLSLLLTVLLWSDCPLFVWGDVAFVFLISSLPVSAILALTFAHRLNTSVGSLIGLMLILLPFLLPEELPQNHLALRWGIATCYTSGILFMVLAVTPVFTQGQSFRLAPEWVLLSCLVLVLPASIYSQVRLQREQERLGRFLDQSRIGEAYLVTQQLLRWNPNLQWRDRPVRIVERELNQIVIELTNNIQAPLEQTATIPDKLERARTLAILGQTQAALKILGTIPLESLSPSARNLAATIHEAREEWSRASDWYQLALAGSQSARLTPDSAEETEVLRAWQGVGFNERKQGNLAAAEFAYQELLKRSPTAEHHFLLGQFYEDTQQSMPAREHIRRAIQLAPNRYRIEGERLLKQLKTGHFGCLQVFRQDHKTTIQK